MAPKKEPARPAPSGFNPDDILKVKLGKRGAKAKEPLPPADLPPPPPPPPPEEVPAAMGAEPEHYVEKGKKGEQDRINICTQLVLLGIYCIKQLLE